jgi:MFS family permease
MIDQVRQRIRGFSHSFRLWLAEYPRQFWVLFVGTLINALGNGFILPFLAIYIHDRLHLPPAQIDLFIAVTFGVGLVSQAASGPLIDHYGRKPLMVVSLLLSSLVMVGFGLAHTLTTLAPLAILAGLVFPLFAPASSAMVADLIEPAQRVHAYGLLRVVSNLGFALGPAIGGLIASQLSFLVLFLASASAIFLYFLLALIFMRETKPPTTQHAQLWGTAAPKHYPNLLRHGPFLAFCGISTLMTLIYAQMYTNFPIYLRTHGFSTQQYGLLMTINAAMIAFLQWPITRWTCHHRKTRMLALGASLYGIGFGAIALSQHLLSLSTDVIIWTLGEMIAVPVGSSLVADLAPQALRGRYMSVYALTWGLGFSGGAIAGGYWLSHLNPQMLWYMAFLIGFFSALSYLMLRRFIPADRQAP